LIVVVLVCLLGSPTAHAGWPPKRLRVLASISAQQFPSATRIKQKKTHSASLWWLPSPPMGLARASSWRPMSPLDPQPLLFRFLAAFTIGRRPRPEREPVRPYCPRRTILDRCSSTRQPNSRFRNPVRASRREIIIEGGTCGPKGPSRVRSKHGGSVYGAMPTPSWSRRLGTPLVSETVHAEQIPRESRR